MSKIIIQSIQDIAPYTGPHAIPGIRFRAAREAMGVTSWGMNILELDPRCEGYPEHDHRKDGQEEVYLLLSGQALLEIDGQRYPLTQGQLVRVPPECTRKFITKEHSASFLALGGTPGQAYQAD